MTSDENEVMQELDKLHYHEIVSVVCAMREDFVHDMQTVATRLFEQGVPFWEVLPNMRSKEACEGIHEAWHAK